MMLKFLLMQCSRSMLMAWELVRTNAPNKIRAMMTTSVEETPTAKMNLLSNAPDVFWVPLSMLNRC